MHSVFGNEVVKTALKWRTYIGKRGAAPLRENAWTMTAPLPDPDRLLETLAGQMRATTSPEAGIVGIYTGGAWVAERLHRALGVRTPLGLLAVTLHRDDYGRIGLHRESRRSHLPFEVEGRDIVVVDDVLHTGRTIHLSCT